MFKKLILLFIIPFYLYSQNLEQTPVKLIKKEDSSTVIETTNLTIDDNTNIENQIALQNKMLEDIITNINNENFMTSFPSSSEYDEEINFLINRINANKRFNNYLAVKRDEIKILYLSEKKEYENTLKSIIIAKQEYKDKKYFKNLIEENIKLINNSDIGQYAAIYESEKKTTSKVSTEFVNNYIDLFNQSNTQLFVLNYLLENISKFRPLNFLIDEFNFQYLVNKIDEIKGIAFISKLTTYYMKFSVGEIIVVLFILIFFRLINKYIITLLASFISRVFIKGDNEHSQIIRQYLRISLDSPLIFALYTLSFQISIYILIKDQEIISKMLPWINTIYIALLTWAIYAIINNSINIYAHSLLEKYPNVRKEMIVFLLRITKILLIVFVIIFLLSQLGIDIKAIIASLGVGGIAVALAAKDTLANFFGSLNIMTDNSFSQGDWIKTNDVEGTVVDIRMRTTRIRTFDNAMITIPNSQLASSHILNWSKRVIGRRIKMSIGITYESKMSDIKNLKDDIHHMLKTHPEIASGENTHIDAAKIFESTKREDLHGIKNTLLVFIDEYGGSSINILVYCFSKSPVWEDWLKTKEDVIMKISELVEKNNCEFAYPTQAIILKNHMQAASMQEGSN